MTDQEKIARDLRAGLVLLAAIIVLMLVLIGVHYQNNHPKVDQTHSSCYKKLAKANSEIDSLNNILSGYTFIDGKLYPRHLE